MPLLQLFTTISAHKIPVQFAPKLAKLLAQQLNKPLNRMAVHINTDQIIYDGEDPEGKQENAYAILRSIGGVSAQQNRSTIVTLSTFMKSELDIDSNRFRVFFINLDPELSAYKNKLFKDLSS